MKYVYTVYGSEDGLISVWSSFPKASDAGLNYVQNARQGQYFDIMIEQNPEAPGDIRFSNYGISATVERWALK